MKNQDNRELTITRIFNAPRELVWRMWTDAKHIQKWWGPKGFTNPVCEWNAEVGGKILIHMQAPDGVVYPMDGEFQDIIGQEKLVFWSGALDRDGRHLFTIVNTINFFSEGDKTKVVLHFVVSNIVPDAAPYLAGMETGWNMSLDKLANYIIDDQSIVKNEPFVIERIYNAPVAKVWQAISNENEMRKWYFDLPGFRPEIGYEFQFEGGPDGRVYIHICRITEVIPFKKLAYSWRYKGYEGDSLVTFELFEDGDATMLKLTHSGLESFPANNPDLARANFAAGWTHIIGTSLAEFLGKSL